MNCELAYSVSSLMKVKDRSYTTLFVGTECEDFYNTSNEITAGFYYLALLRMNHLVK